jgi:hypothetical protein
MRGSLSGTVGTLACWAYALIWAAFWWFSDAMPAVLAALEPIVSRRTHAVIAVGIAGLVLFGCAPLMREAERIKRIFYAFAIFALIAPGLWLAATGWVEAAQIFMWLVIPLVIALWVLQGGTTVFWPPASGD